MARQYAAAGQEAWTPATLLRYGQLVRLVGRMSSFSRLNMELD